MDQIKINGLLWDAENLEIDGKTYFTFDEAQEAAMSVGKRLPTGQEYRQLKKLWTKWDEERMGMRFRDDDNNELILLALGDYSPASNMEYNVGEIGKYWTSTASEIWADYLYFHKGAINPDGFIMRDASYSVRCVQDIE